MSLKFIILSGVVMHFIYFTTFAQRSRNVQDHILIKESVSIYMVLRKQIMKDLLA